MNAASSTQPLPARELSSLRQRRRSHFTRAAVVGVSVAIVAVSFQATNLYVQELLDWVRQATESVFLLDWLAPITFCAIAGALAGYLTESVAPEAEGSGIPHVRAVLLRLRTLRPMRLFIAKFLGGALVLGSGFSLGREGPTVHLGAVVAAGFAKLFKVPQRAANFLVACGAGAGLAAAFNAPLAGVLFVIEELRKELSPITYGSAFVAAVLADAVVRFVMGPAPSLSLSIYPSPPLFTIPVVILLGCFVGGGGIIFNRLLIATIRKTPATFPRWKRALCAGILVGFIGIIFPKALLPVQGIIDLVLQPHTGVSLTIVALGALLCLKLLLTVACYATGVPGGIFAPMLIQGALLGLFFGRCAELVVPAEHLSFAVYGILGMAAFLSAAIRSPLTSVVLVAEMTGNFELLFVLLVASLSAYLVAEWAKEKPIYESLLEMSLRRPSGGDLNAPTEPLLVDIVVEAGSPLDGISVSEVTIPSGCALMTIRRGYQDNVPHGTLAILPGDEISVLVNPDAMEAVQELRDAAEA